LVVFTIIAILIALLLPAVQAAREAARKVQCSNHLKQLALGCLSHEQHLGFLPVDGLDWKWIGDPDLGFGEQQVGGWIYNVLPFIEQGAFHDVGAGRSAAEKNALWTKAVETPIPVLFCPARGPPMACPPPAWMTVGGIEQFRNVTYSPTMRLAHNDYAINCGWMRWGPYAPPPNLPVPNPHNDSPDGMLGARLATGCRAKVYMMSITDGTSNTYLIGEKYAQPEQYGTSEDDSYGGSAYGGHDFNTARYTSFLVDFTTGLGMAWPPHRDEVGFGACMAFGSAHAHSLNMAFCDGSVQPISYAIDGKVHACFGHRHDGKVIPAGAY
jgi:prepilin-type processing-associated H-X9-DG protein